MIERPNRSAIFDKILSDDRNGIRTPATRPRNLGTSPGASSPTPLRVVPESEIKSCKEKGLRAVAHSDYETAAREFERALSLANGPEMQLPDLIQLHLSHGEVLQRKGDCTGAEKAYERAEKLIATGVAASLARQRVALDAQRGLLAFASGNVVDAERYYIDAINTFETECEMDPERLAELYLQLGSVYTEVSHFEQAMQIVLEGLTYLEEGTHDVPLQKMRMFQLLATIAFKKGELDATVQHLLEAYKFAQEVEGQRSMVELEATLATVYAQHEQFPIAAEWFETAIRRQEATDASARWPLGLLYANLAQVQMQMHQDSAAQTFSRSVDHQLSYLAVKPCLS